MLLFAIVISFFFWPLDTSFQITWIKDAKLVFVIPVLSLVNLKHFLLHLKNSPGCLIFYWYHGFVQWLIHKTCKQELNSNNCFHVWQRENSYPYWWIKPKQCHCARIVLTRTSYCCADYFNSHYSTQKHKY